MKTRHPTHETDRNKIQIPFIKQRVSQTGLVFPEPCHMQYGVYSVFRSWWVGRKEQLRRSVERMNIVIAKVRDNPGNRSLVADMAGFVVSFVPASLSMKQPRIAFGRASREHFASDIVNKIDT